ncbi:MGMT family protein [Parahaliea aestuarii]|uniref:MGMT family protein n=1 Tax=Parahaliea aestuarii TaxID=1852021 RepID=A0A5C8ZQW2_9GAMM|nr:MGMT family protein [Parahaliea aestuarii]TXS90050.1 MGMT family protein [Parahaliea aestuarii]
MADTSVDLNQRIWQVVASIPPGEVSTYGDVARFAGLPGAARRVGYALRQLPPGSKVPWHRVINSQGRISLPAGSAGEYTQRERLEAEGVRVCGGKVALGRFRWQP